MERFCRWAAAARVQEMLHTLVGVSAQAQMAPAVGAQRVPLR